MKMFKTIVTNILRIPVEETGMLPLSLLVIIITLLSLVMRFFYY